MDVLPSDFDLFWLFEVEPQIQGPPDLPDAYKSRQYTTVRQNDTVECVMDLGDNRFDLRWSRDGVILVNVTLRDVIGYRVQKLKESQLLVVISRLSGVAPLLLQMRPTIQVTWETDPFYRFSPEDMDTTALP